MKKLKIILVLLCFLVLFFVCINMSIAIEENNNSAEINSVGPGGGGALYQPSFNPQDEDNFFLTCDMGSSFVTHDGGETFQSLSLGRSVSAAGMPNYWFTPHDENTVFATAGTIVYVSYDKGRTWDFMFPSKEDYIGMAHNSVSDSAHPQFKEGTLIANPHVLISFYADPNDPNILYTMSSGRSHGWPIVPAEVYRSTDKGKTWHVFKTLNDAPWIDAAANGNNFTIWVDQLQGTTAQMMLFDGELRISTHQGMFRLDAKTGETIWNKRIDVNRYTTGVSGGLGGTTNMVVKDGKMTVYMTMWEGTKPERYVNGVYKSTNFGESWELITGNFITDAKTIEGRTIGQHFGDTWFDGWAITNVTFGHIATSGNRLYASYVGNDWRVDGLAMTEDEGKTWTIVLIGANKNQRNGYGGYANQFDVVGPIDDKAGSTSWSGIKSRGLAINPNNPEHVITTNMAEAWMTTNGGDTWRSLASKRTDGGQAPVPATGETPFWTTTGIEPAAQHTLAIDPFNRAHHLTGWTDIGIFETFDNGDSWTHKSVSKTYAGNSHAIAFDPHNEGVVLAAYTSRQYAGAVDITTVNNPNATRDGGLARSTDGGKTWTSSILGDPSSNLLSDSNNSGLPRRSIINSIIFDPVNKGLVYVLCSGAGVYKSTDGGVTFTPFNIGIDLQTNGNYKGISGTMRLSEDGKAITLINDGIAYKLDISAKSTAWIKIKGVEKAKLVRMEMDNNGVLYATTKTELLSDEKVPFGENGTRVNIGKGGAWVSKDNGETWKQIYTDMYQISDIVSDSRNSNILYLTSREGKVYASNKGTETTLKDWIELEGFNFHAPTYIFEDPQDSKVIYTATTCGGTWKLEIPFSVEKPEEPVGKTRLRIKDNENNKIAGATIKVYENNNKRENDIVTNTDGETVIENMVKGNTYKIDVSKQGYISQVGIVLANIETENQVLTKEIVLQIDKNNEKPEEPEAPEKVIGKMQLTIKDNIGKGINGATIKVYENNIKRDNDLTTDKEGKVVIENIIKGNTYKIDVLKQGYTSQLGIVLSNIETENQILIKEIVLLVDNSNDSEGEENNNPDVEENNNNTENETNNNENNNNTNNNNSNNENTGKDYNEGEYEGKLPNTGEKPNTAIYFTIVAAISAIFFGIRYAIFKY